MRLSFVFFLRACVITGLILLPFSGESQKAKPVRGYGTATYSLTHSEQFMRNWLLAGPFPVGNNIPDEATQKEFFKSNSLTAVEIPKGKKAPDVTIGGKKVSWQLYSSPGDIVNLDEYYNKPDYVTAYALAEINAAQEVKTFLGVGSDDGIQIWHNGKLIHDNWIPRGITKDEDLVPITLIQGSNQILIKVQDIGQDWGFVIRVLGKEGLSNKLINAAAVDDLEEVNKLIEAGADPNKRNASGINALHAARLKGREEISAFLIEKGAKDEPFPTPEVYLAGFYENLNKKKAPGIALLVARDGKVIYRGGFGYADIENSIPISTETKFRIGSVTKQFIGTAILKLQEEGKLSVNDKLSRFLPDFPRGEEVTVHHLLTHTSGIRSYTGKQEFMERVTSPISEDDLIAFFRDDAYDFSPGESFQYNNSGYFLLGYIIRKVTGLSYGEYLKKAFFDPLGMANTGVHASNLTLTQEAKGYTKENEQYKPSLNWDMSWAGGAGSLYSTVGDLFLWNEALYNGNILQEKSYKAMIEPVTLNNGQIPPSGKYGYGLFTNEYRGVEKIEHSGGLHGFVSQLARYPEERFTVVMLTNITPTEVMLNTNTIAEFFLSDRMEKQKTMAIAEGVKENLKDFEGRYDFQNGAVMTISTEDEKLFAQLSGQPKFQIFPSGGEEYFWKVVDARIKFVRDETGAVTFGEFQQNGMKLKVSKMAEQPLFNIDKKLYTLYEGKYKFADNFTITVFVEGEKLFTQGTNQPRMEIYPLSETEFTAREINAKITFIKEQTGKVNTMILEMAGQKRELPRLEP